MKFNRKRALTPREIRILSLFGLAALIVLSVWVGANIWLSRTVPGGGGFFSGWAGALLVFSLFLWGAGFLFLILLFSRIILER
ncbi:MAG: hypothetical protein HYR93_09700, partial [Chloroflexi bacterium]|nr:hypothetical protein [Chloroflexota bacterium]